MEWNVWNVGITFGRVVREGVEGATSVEAVRLWAGEPNEDELDDGAPPFAGTEMADALGRTPANE